MKTLKNLGLLFALLSVVCTSVSSDEKQANEDMTSLLEADKYQIVLMCEVGCRQDEERTGYARLHWSGITIKEKDIRLDFTVYESGFEEDAYGTFLLNNEEEPQLGKAIHGHNIRAFDVRLTQTSLAENREETSFATVERLEPGLYYQWRLRNRVGEKWVANKIMVCTAPVCIAE